MSKNKKMVWLFCFIIVNMFLIISFLVVRDATEANKLSREIKSLIKLDITKDRYNTKLKSSGSYGVVEKAIKTYLDDYAVNIQSIMKTISDDQFKSLLSVDNYTSDGPEFANSIMYINSEKKKFNEDIDELIDVSSEKSIKEYIYKYTDEGYYVALYEKLMFGDAMTKDFNNTRKTLENTKVQVNEIFDTSTEIFNFLNSNKGSWQIEDGEIKFKTNDMVNYYNSLITKIK